MINQEETPMTDTLVEDPTRRFVSNSELQAFKGCRRRWYLTYVRGLKAKRTREHGPLPLGNRVHSALEVGEAGGAEAALKLYDQLAEASRGRLDPEIDDEKKFETENTMGRLMVEGYYEWLAEEGLDQGVEVVGVEEALSTSLDLWTHDGLEVFLIGKMDKRVRDPLSRQIRFLDYKTTKGFNDVSSTLQLNEQLKTYGVLERRNLVDGGEPATGAIFELLRKVGRSKTAKPPFYKREAIAYSDVELRNFWHRLRSEVADLLVVEQTIATGGDHTHVAYPRPSRDCTWICPFFSGCHMFDDGSDVEAWLDDQFEVGDPLLRYRDENRHPDIYHETDQKEAE
jgi:RecB family exonuclease